MTEISKGPWAHRPVDSAVFALRMRDEVVAADGSLVTKDVVTEADAIAISAVPDMLAALREAREGLPHPLDDRDQSPSARRYRAVDSAIAKAEGK